MRSLPVGAKLAEEVRRVPQGSVPLLQPFQLGPLQLAHRVVMAPLTRDRATGTVPQPSAATYYSQRATKGGLIITEATCISEQGHGYPDTPGIYSRQQVEAWKPVVQSVKKAGAVFVSQIWHVGRASHGDYQPDGGPPVGPSANQITLEGAEVYTQTGAHPYPKARALHRDEIKPIVDQYAQAAKNALEAGFDAVEIHGANSYLIDQFLKKNVNERTDEYGGSIENRCRFGLEVVDAVVAAVGAERTGIRISPFGSFLEPASPDARELFEHFVTELSARKLLYVHCIEARVGSAQTMFGATVFLLGPKLHRVYASAIGEGDAAKDEDATASTPFRKAFKGPFLSAGGYNRDTGNRALELDAADCIVYGRWFLANPDLPERFAHDKPLNKYKRDLFYANEQVKGYIDYPFLKDIPNDAKVEVLRGVKVYA